MERWHTWYRVRSWMRREELEWTEELEEKEEEKKEWVE